MFLVMTRQELASYCSLCVSRDVSLEKVHFVAAGKFALREQGCFRDSEVCKRSNTVRSA